MFRATPAIRAVARIELPSTRHRMTVTRSEVLSRFILDIMLDDLTEVKHFVQIEPGLELERRYLAKIFTRGLKWWLYTLLFGGILGPAVVVRCSGGRMDLNKNAFRIVRSLTEETKRDRPRSEAARAAGKLGGPARARRLTAEERRAIAIRASAARWQKST